MVCLTGTNMTQNFSAAAPDKSGPETPGGTRSAPTSSAAAAPAGSSATTAQAPSPASQDLVNSAATFSTLSAASGQWVPALAGQLW